MTRKKKQKIIWKKCFRKGSEKGSFHCYEKYDGGPRKKFLKKSQKQEGVALHRPAYASTVYPFRPYRKEKINIKPMTS